MIAQTIQLALAPVFVLVAIANLMNLLSSRLGRVVDRSRELERRHGQTTGRQHDLCVLELRVVARRIELIGRAIVLLVWAGLAIGFTVVLLFVGEFTGMDYPQIAAGVFILSIGLMMAALVYFARETRAAAAALRIPDTYLELDRSV